MTQVDTIAQQSSADGQRTVARAHDAGADGADRSSQKLDGHRRRRAAERRRRPRRSRRPGRLRDRERGPDRGARSCACIGVDGLAHGASSTTVGVEGDVRAEALALSEQAYRLLASDVVWDDLFLKPAGDRAQRGGRRRGDRARVALPRRPRPDRDAHARWRSSLTRIIAGAPDARDAAAACTARTSSRSRRSRTAPAGSPGPEPGTLNTVDDELEPRLPGDDPRRRGLPGGADPGQLTIGRPQSPGRPDHEDGDGAADRPGRRRLGRLRRPRPVPFASQTTVTVDVARVPGETNIANNSAQYNVIFSLPG